MDQRKTERSAFKMQLQEVEKEWKLEERMDRSSGSCTSSWVDDDL